MATMITDRELEKRLQSERAATGADRYDEVWEGTYLKAPMPNDEHQEIVSRLVSVFEEVVGWPGLGRVRPGVNVSDRRDNWKANYRVPDVAVFLNDGSAENLGAFWLGGPDFLVEIISPEDQTREKIPFYDAVGVREMLLIDRDPWLLEHYGRRDGALRQVGCCNVGESECLASDILPFRFQLVEGPVRPAVQVLFTKTQKEWRV